MKVKSVNRDLKLVVFEEGGMSFAIHEGEVTDWSGRRPNPAEFKSALKQYFAITK